MENQEKRYFFDIPIHCELGHLLEKIGMEKESQGKTPQEKTRTFQFTIIAFCGKCEKLMTFNANVAITRKIQRTQFLPRIKGLPVDKYRQTNKISR